MGKAKTKSQKRRGRPKKEDVYRTESGQISRAKDPPSKLALEARARMHKISVERAKDQHAATYLGRLHMAYMAWKKLYQEWEKRGRGMEPSQPSQSISTRQYFALLQYRELHNDYLKAIGAPGAYYEPRLSANEGDDDATAEWRTSVITAHKDASEAIQQMQNAERSHNLWAALDYCVLREEEHAYMIGALRELGNALSRHFARA